MKKLVLVVSLVLVLVSCTDKHDIVQITNNSKETIRYWMWDDNTTYTLQPGNSTTHTIVIDFPSKPDKYEVVNGHNSVDLTRIDSLTYSFENATQYPLAITASFPAGITLTIREFNDRMNDDNVSVIGNTTGNTGKTVYTQTPRFIVESVIPSGAYSPIIDKPIFSNGNVNITIH